MFTHEDDRRRIVDFGSGNIRGKALTAKRDCIVGDHYHLRKDEQFLLFQGEAPEIVVGGEVYRDVKAPAEFTVLRGTYHRFQLKAGSVLIGTASAEFDPGDEIKGHPHD